MKVIKRLLKGFLILAGTLTVAALALGLIAGGNGNAGRSAATKAPAATAVAAKPAIVLPAGEQELIDISAKGAADFDDGANDMAKGAARPRRAAAICKALRSTTVHDWIGTVDQLSSNGDGKGVLGVRIAKNVTLETWNNALSDISDQTLIAPASQVFKEASAMKVGQTVRFSGSFIRSQTDCIEERSMTLEGSMKEPAYIFRFSSVGPDDRD